jgi:Domain of unknown function (DUF3459)
VRKGRYEEFAAFGWGDAVPDPQAEATFESCRLDRGKLDDPQHSGMVELYRDLITMRRRCVVRGAWCEGPGGQTEVVCRDGVITLEQPMRDGLRVLAVFNCSDREQEVSLPEASWQLVLSTDDVKYAGRVGAEVRATVGAAAGSRAGGSRMSGEEWKNADHAPRTAHRAPPWTAAIYTESDQ